MHIFFSISAMPCYAYEYMGWFYMLHMVGWKWLKQVYCILISKRVREGSLSRGGIHINIPVYNLGI